VIRVGIAAALLGSLAAAQGETGRWTPVDRRDGLPSEEVLDLCPGDDECLWAATAAGLCRVERHGIQSAEGVPPGRTFALAPDGMGGVFAFRGAEIYRVRRGGAERLGSLAGIGPPPPSHVVGHAGVLWVLGDEAIQRRDPDGTWTLLPHPPAGTPASCLGLEGETLLALAGGSLWALDGGGWKRRGPAPAARLSRGAGDMPPPSFAEEPANACARHAGMIWCATSRMGILRRTEKPRFRRIELPLSSRVNALAEAPDGSVWCGTERGLVRVADGPAEVIETVDGMHLGAVTAVAVDREGRLWVGSGSSFNGLYRREGGRWTRFGRDEGFLDAYVHRITLDPSGALWIAALNAPGKPITGGEGAWVYADGTFRPSPAHRELPSGRVYDVVARGPEGWIWFATLEGLAAFDGRRLVRYGAETLAGAKAWCLCAARDGSLWVGYQTGGLGVSRLARGSVRRYQVADGLGHPDVWSIVEGERGVLWFATEGGLSRYDGKRWSHFDVRDGLPAAPLWPLLPAPGGGLWIGTLGGGLVRMEPGDRLGPRTHFVSPPSRAVAGESVLVRWRGADAWFDTPPADLWYRWRIGDGPWSDATPATQARIDATPGEHRFQVQAIDRFGNAEDPPAELTLRVARPFPYGWTVAGLAALALGALALRWARPRLGGG